MATNVDMGKQEEEGAELNKKIKGNGYKVKGELR